MPSTKKKLTPGEREQRMTDIGERVQELRAMPHLTGVQESEFDALTREFDELNAASVMERLAAGELTLEHGSQRDDRPQFGTSERDKARRIIDAAHRSSDLTADAATKAEKLVTDGSTVEQSHAARWAVTTGAPAYRTAFAKLLGSPERGHLLWTPEEGDAFRAVEAFKSEERAMSLSGSNGGYMVPLTLDPAINLTSDGSINPLRKISRVVQTSTNAWQGVTSAGASAEWKSEATQSADGSPTLDDPSIPVHFGDVFVPYSFEIGMDGASFLEELTKVLVDAADQLMATAYTTGDGSGEPTGIIHALDGTASEVAPSSAESLTKADPYKVQNALPPRFQANAQWCAALATINTLAQAETTSGSLQFAEIADNRLLRKPLNELSNMDGSINPAATADNFVLLYGDFQQFVIVDRIGTTIDLIPHLFGANGRPSAQRGAFLYFRTGSDVLVPEAFRVLNVATAA